MNISNYNYTNSYINNENINNIKYPRLKCYDELFKTHQTQRLILSRTIYEDLEPLGKLILNQKVNHYYNRPIIFLATLDKAKEYIKNQANNNVCFTIKLKDNLIPIGLIGFYYADYTCNQIGVFYFIGEKYQKKGYASEAACPLIRHLFDNLPLTSVLKIDFEKSNIGSRKVAMKICDDIMKFHPNYIRGELTPFVDKYTLLPEPPILGKVSYYFEGYDRQYSVLYPQNFFNGVKYFEVLSNGYFIKKQ